MRHIAGGSEAACPAHDCGSISPPPCRAQPCLLRLTPDACRACALLSGLQVGDLRKGPQGAAAGQYEVLLKRKQYEVRKYTRLPQGAPAYGGDGSEAGAGGGSGGVYAVADFSGAASQAAAAAVEQALRRALLADGLRPAGRCWQLVAGGGDEGGPNPARWRNEVLVPLEAFQLWA